MPYLDAALAFALTMLAISTLVTWILRAGQWLLSLRKKGMKQMLGDFFSKELQPVVERELDRLQVTANDKFIEAAKNLGVEKLYSGENPMLTREEYEKLSELSKEELDEWLKRSELGRKLLRDLGDRAESIFEELGKRYDAVGVKFSKSFREKARLWSTVLAFFVALLLNIDSIFIAKTYMSNEGIRQAVIAQKDSLEQGYTDLQQTLEQDPTETISLDEFKQAFSDAEAQLDVFTSAGFPIGSSYYPNLCKQESENPDCAARSWGNSIFGLEIPIYYGDTSWILGIILTSLLGGLGGPFWFDVVSGISRAAQSARASKKQETNKSEG